MIANFVRLSLDEIRAIFFRNIPVNDPKTAASGHYGNVVTPATCPQQRVTTEREILPVMFAHAGI
jgi:hypothetical protein